MELILLVIALLAAFGLLSWAALNWGQSSYNLHVSDSFAERRSNW